MASSVGVAGSWGGAKIIFIDLSETVVDSLNQLVDSAYSARSPNRVNGTCTRPSQPDVQEKPKQTFMQVVLKQRESQPQVGFTRTASLYFNS
eukprot:46380-Amphidinium_carterae.1